VAQGLKLSSLKVQEALERCDVHPSAVHLLCATQVLEAWSYWAALGATSHPELRQQALAAVRAIAEALRESGKVRLIEL
jgi:hypothetical protein